MSLVPFNQVSADYAFKEGEDDRSLAWWRKAHRYFFAPYFKECGLIFTADSKIVLEEFEVVYPEKWSSRYSLKNLGDLKIKYNDLSKEKCG